MQQNSIKALHQNRKSGYYYYDYYYYYYYYHHHHYSHRLVRLRDRCLNLIPYRHVLIRWHLNLTNKFIVGRRIISIALASLLSSTASQSGVASTQTPLFRFVVDLLDNKSYIELYNVMTC